MLSAAAGALRGPSVDGDVGDVAGDLQLAAQGAAELAPIPEPAQEAQRLAVLAETLRGRDEALGPGLDLRDKGSLALDAAEAQLHPWRPRGEPHPHGLGRRRLDHPSARG